MNKTIAVIGDSHFHEASRFEECIRLHDWIAEDAATRGVDLFIHTGDVYEAKSTPRERDAVAAWMQRIASIAPVVVVRGNHDALEDLPLLERLETDCPIKVVETAEVVSLVNGIAVACVAWPRKAFLEAAGVDPATAMRDILRGLGEQLRHDVPEDWTRLLASHAMVRGSQTSTGQPLVGVPLELGIDDLALVGADAYALGHIHLHQAWEIAGAPCFYPGSPRRTSFGEPEAKGYVVLECDVDVCGCSQGYARGACGVCDNRGSVDWTFVEVPATPMLLLESRWHGGDVCDFFPNGGTAEVRGAEVRFRYECAADQRDAARRAASALRDAMLSAGAVSVKLDEVVNIDARARAPEVAAATTIAAKLDALWASRRVNVAARRPALMAKLAQLEEAGRG